MRSKFNPRKRHVFVLTYLSRSDDIATLDSPCAKPMPLKVMQMSLKDWKNGQDNLKWAKASIFLATTTQTSSFRPETVQPNTQSQGTNLQSSDQGIIHDKSGHAADVRLPTPSDAVRLRLRSPWPSVVIELLSGENIDTAETWIYPFKQIVIYEKQIRKFVELLNEIEVDGVEAKDLSSSLGRILSEVVRDLGPRRDEVEYSDTYVSSILQKRSDLANHYSKIRKSTAGDQEEELEDTEAGLSGIAPVDDPSTENSERSNLSPEVKPVPEEAHYMCTCFKDARDHLQLLVNTIDSHMGSLVSLRKAIRDQALSKIRFEHLWHLFQPGDLVVTSRQPHQAFRVMHVSGGRPLLTTDVKGRDKDAEARPTFHHQSQVSPFNIDCVRFDFDGEKFGPVQETITIFEYEEDRIITKLEVYPMSYAEKEETLVQRLLDRGRRFAMFHDSKHMRYEGLSLSEPQEEVNKVHGLFFLE